MAAHDRWPAHDATGFGAAGTGRPSRAGQPVAGGEDGDGRQDRHRRSRAVYFRVTEREWEALHKQADAAGLTVTDYILGRTVYAEFASFLTSREELIQVRLELARQGNNLNQMAHRLNALDTQDVRLADAVRAEVAATMRGTTGARTLTEHLIGISSVAGLRKAPWAGGGEA